MKLGLTHLVYVPATTRAAFSRLGSMSAFEIDGQRFALPPEEMPGEVEWRTEFLRWMTRRCVHYLARRPREQWVKTMLEVEDEAVKKQLLLNVESRVVAEGALTCLQELTPSELEQFASNAALHDAELSAMGMELSDKFSAMVVDYGSRV
ncbi:hypothetical protein [Paraburkholderia fungorum]|uniref:hypothetical protein n=1 Tax=Paraburkholderia fungorum TaxID=134537 RepID=UPI00209351C3|nr:hypothetical protein [Paraburkholderia fungorum]USU18912.1 hypothetical protein NFE55_32715 [Paraburkholderia fungorum]USU29092.1 hypothetical protein NFS19_28855 [Paraburkholderia fungorum]